MSTGVFLDLVLALLAAFLGGVVAQRIGLPVVVGYVLAGVAVGPFTPGLRLRPGAIELLAEIGVAFLMFVVGAELSRTELRRLGRVALVAGLAEILFLTALGPALGRLLGAPGLQGLFLGAMLSLSSTVVALKVLEGRGELESLHGRAALGVLIVQDLAAIPMVVALPASAQGGEIGWRLPLIAGQAAGLVVGAYVLGDRVVPWVLAHVARARSRELFLLGVVVLVLGTSLAAQAIGLSLAFGAFLAGLVVAESEFRAQVVAVTLPFRDLFASLFFLSLGMLVDPAVLLAHASTIALLTAAVILGKLLVVAVALLALGLSGRVAIMAGLAVGQVGEFSFVVAQVGVGAGAVPRLFFDLVLATALTSVILFPFVLRAGPGLLWVLRHLPRLGARFEDPAEPDPRAVGLRRHVVVAGCGRVGRELVETLRRRGLPHLVIEYDPEVVGRLRAEGVPVVYGDASNPGVLEHARLDRARLLAALVPNPAEVEAMVRVARELNPRLDVIARARDAEQVGRLHRAGANEVVQPEFEAGVEVIRHTLQRFGVVGAELGVLITGRRRAFYERD
ncbi:MAG TPA: cation:proton antiporter [Candidatus Dormibacteraeota bacterium]|jgi:CPA2 family monovalent cation:H+ antiporter-2|nr:cation:proton antiporter [Candidatus Dormibacteraeota bacterium]